MLLPDMPAGGIEPGALFNLLIGLTELPEGANDHGARRHFIIRGGCSARPMIVSVIEEVI
jgi:hypothetical protein